MTLTFPDIDPVAFSIGPLDIRWYALSYIAGFLLGWWYCLYLIKCRKTDVVTQAGGACPTKTELDDFIPWAVAGVIFGGRIGYVLFYNAGHYFENPADIIRVWQGGMSFHGGLIGATIAMFMYARVNRLSFFGLADLVACAAPVGLFFGRIANFVNGELIGRYAPDLPWAIVFPHGGMIPRHPSQLYEAALEGGMIFVVLFIMARYTKFMQKPGVLCGFFLVMYAGTRAFAELYRQPDEHIGFLFGGMTMGQILCIPMAIIGLATILYALHPLRDQTLSATKK